MSARAKPDATPIDDEPTKPARRPRKTDISADARLAVRFDTAGVMLDCHANKVRQLCNEGKLRTIKLGADKRVDVASIKHYIAKGGDV